MNCWIELDFDILTRNINAVSRAVNPNTEIIFVVKSDAYGHGMIPVASHAYSQGINWFAVSYANEALKLRAALPDAGIIAVGAVHSSEVQDLIKNRIIPLLVSPSHAEALSNAAASAGMILECHLKIDTGMGRLGFRREKLTAQIPVLLKLPGLKITGTCSHFASSDSNIEFAAAQYQHFNEALESCRTAGLEPGFRHMSNSGGVISCRDWNLNGVRPGILLYGCCKGAENNTEPFINWKTTVIQVKKVPEGFPVSYDSTYITERATTIATINAGYADGYPRSLSNKARVLIRGRRCPVAGRITMNLITVDCGPDTDIEEGDEVVLLGKQQNECVRPAELAELAGTIPYEILTGIRASVLN